MANKVDIPLFPVASWQLGPIPRLGLISLCPNFLTNLSQRPEEANQGRHYVLTPKQAQDLINDLTLALQNLQKSAPEAHLGQKH
jgi:hypothetical protein